MCVDTNLPAVESHSSDDDDNSDFYKGFLFAPVDVDEIAMTPKDDYHGIGYRGLDPAMAGMGQHVALFEESVCSSGGRRGISGQVMKWFKLSSVYRVLPGRGGGVKNRAGASNYRCIACVFHYFEGIFRKRNFIGRFLLHLVPLKNVPIDILLFLCKRPFPYKKEIPGMEKQLWYVLAESTLARIRTHILNNQSSERKSDD